MRINLIGGPGCWKSNLAASLYSFFDAEGYSIELVREQIKKKAYKKEVIKGFDQIKYLGKQLAEEEFYLRHGVKNIITDSPLLVNYIYAKKHNAPCYDSILEIVKEFDNIYPCVYIYLIRPNNYKEAGRWENLEEAKNIDSLISNQLINFLHVRFRSEDFKNVSSYIRDCLRK